MDYAGLDIYIWTRDTKHSKVEGCEINMKTNTICNCSECGKNGWNVEFKSDFYQYMPTFDKFDEMYLDGWFIFKCTSCGFAKEFAVGD